MRVSEEFLDGIYEVYSVLMTDQIYFRFLDEKSTIVNEVYDETITKNYSDPLQFVGKVVLNVEQGAEEVEGTSYDLVATIPTKSLINEYVDFTPENYHVLEQGIITYKGVDYIVHTVKPKTNIDDVFQFYDFYCEKSKVRR